MTLPILIIGATGGVGQQLVKKYIERDEKVRLLVRDPVRAEKQFGSAPEYIVGDSRYPLTLPAAFEGIEQVISTTGSRNPTGDNNPRQVDYEGVFNLVEIAKQHSIKHFVLVSSIAVTRPEHPLNKFGNVLDWKLKGEQALRTSGLTYTIVRPGGLTDAPGGQSELIFSQGDQINGVISRADVAEVCIQALKFDRAKNTTFEVIAGPGLAENNWGTLFNLLQTGT